MLSALVFSGDLEIKGNEHFILVSVKIKLLLFNFTNSVIKFKK
jgi:hypothetical protein